MTEHGGRRSQAERDAITVEIGYALCSALFAAAVVFGAIAGPALLFDLAHSVETVLLHTGMVLAPVLFLVRVVSVLVRFGRPDQPSQPGRTNPDS
jgi:ABC-type Na+ efflux pump permease subunit